MRNRINVLVLHDRMDSTPPFVDYLKRHGFNVEWCKTGAASLKRVREGLGSIDVVILHKDLGDVNHERNIDADKVIDEIHDEAPHVRVIVSSGEYPEGREHVLKMHADAYFSPLNYIEPWTLGVIHKGQVNGAERKKRGHSVEMPPRPSFRERRY